MRSLHLTILIFCQILLASFILYSTITSASPVQQQAAQPQAPIPVIAQAANVASKPAVAHAAEPAVAPAPVQPKVEASKPAVVQHAPAPAPEVKHVAPEAVKSVVAHQPVSEVKAQTEAVKPVVVSHQQTAAAAAPVSSVVEPAKAQSAPSVVHKEPAQGAKQVTGDSAAPVSPVALEKYPFEKVPAAAKIPIVEPVVAPKPVVASPPVAVSAVKPVAQPVVSVPVEPAKAPQQAVQHVEDSAPVRKAPVERRQEPVAPVVQQAQASVAQVEKSPVAPIVAPKEKEAPSKVAPPASSPAVVKGGLGPLNLLAATLCSYQPEKPVADENLNLLYCRRATVRKALFEFMSLKFTNLEKFSSRLNAGLEVMPPKTVSTSSNPAGAFVPSHGWPVVGKCTSHDLKLMAEAAWCDPHSSPLTPQPSSSVAPPASTAALDAQQPTITSNQHRTSFARSLERNGIPSEQAAVLSKILHVNDVKDAPVVESSIASLNLTQQQLAAAIGAQADSTLECRRNALRLTKALFNHLAEDQQAPSESWPKLYAVMSEDDCARKRTIDIINALASFRSESSSIRRDNVEFAFAMDDLRAKVLDSEVNVPLTFDKQFIEVEQFLQQSVRLMLANINPDRAKLTSMRYRSLMAGPSVADDQCIELHQRLLAKNYPEDYLCNPNQFGQLTDVLRMTANSLELWSIERELSKYRGKLVQEYPSLANVQTNKQDVDQCIANLVSS